MINNRRDELEILADILRLTKGGAKKTQILYRVNLSYSQLENYLSFLKEKNLLEEVETEETRGKIYKINDKGLKLLESIENVFSYLK